MKIFIKELSQGASYQHSPMSKYYQQHPALKHPQYTAKTLASSSIKLSHSSQT
jgi:hypothetical protein